jgi:CBS domain-containing protein
MKKTRPARQAAAATAPIDPSRVPVREVMKTDVLVLRPEDSIRFAAEQFEEIGASGAPVVDGGGRLVGVLTTKDIARSEHLDDQGVSTLFARGITSPAVSTADASGFDEEVSPSAGFGEQLVGQARIGDWMATGVTAVAPDATVGDVCRKMVDEGIHRVFIVEDNRLLGVVSTMDVVALLAAPPRGR